MEPLPLVEDLRTAEGLPVRLYRPAPGGRSLTLYLHGGGFVLGDLDSHDGICWRLAQVADAAVLAVDYRRAPEHPGPAAAAGAGDSLLEQFGRLLRGQLPPARATD